MNDKALKSELTIRQRMAAWSDGDGQTAAIALAERHRHLLPKRITNAQLSGLNNVVWAAPDVARVRDFLTHQASRAERAGRLDVKGYWDDVAQTLVQLEATATQLAAEAGLTVEAPAGRKGRSRAPAWVELSLAQAFVQHLVAHSLYLGAMVRTEVKPE